MYFLPSLCYFLSRGRVKGACRMDHDLLYLQCLEQLTAELADPNHLDLEATYKTIGQMCEMLDACKGVADYYPSLEAERRNEGKTYVCYDTGDEPEEVLTERTVLNNLVVAVCRVCRKKGSPAWTEKQRRRISTVQRMVVMVLGRNRMAKQIEMATLYDDAGYSNIRYFTAAVEKLGRDQLMGRYAAARFNLKHFSLINQELGRDVCDRVMKKYIEKLSHLAGEGGTVSRLGGDNFVALFPKESLDKVISIFEGVPIQFSDGHGRVMVSSTAGIFVIPDDYYYHNFGDVMDRIINAFNAAKGGHAGDIVFSSEQMLEQKEHAMRIRQMFPIAMQNEEILVFYQPKIDIENSALVGAEALSRWYHNGRLVMPAEFIPVLEQSMDICKLDFYVLDRVCRDIRRWLDEGKPVVRVSVNLSRRHLIDLDLLDHILSIIDRNRVPHRYIEIELTETTTDVEFKDLKRIVSGLQEAGVFTSVDDFGIGYSSLNLIREIPWDILKVDKDFLPLDERPTHNRQNVMFRHVVNMAKEIGLTCVAEGVETEEQVRILRKNGCDIAQGFFYDKPLPVREFEQRLTRHFYPQGKEG